MRRSKLNTSKLIGFDEFFNGFFLEGGGDDQQGSLDFLDGVDVVLDDGVDDGLGEHVGGRQDDVEADVVKVERARARERVQQVERLVLLRLALSASDRGGGGIGQEGCLGALGPRLAGLDDGGPQRGIEIQLVECAIQLRGQLGGVKEHLRLGGFSGGFLDRGCGGLLGLSFRHRSF